MQLKFKKTNESGIGLIETLLALGVGIIIITAMVSLSIFTLRASLQNKLQISGTQLASQEIELVRALRDSKDTWKDFTDAVDGTVGPDCFNNDCYMANAATPTVSSGKGKIAPDTAEEVVKSFRITDQSGGSKTLLRVNVSITWKVGTDQKSAHTYTELSDWRDR